jgi:hypothetical protein
MEHQARHTGVFGDDSKRRFQVALQGSSAALDHGLFDLAAFVSIMTQRTLAWATQPLDAKAAT